MRKWLFLSFLLITPLHADDERNNGCIPGIHAQNLVHDLQLINPADGNRFLTADPGFVTGDCKLRKDAGAWQNCQNLPVWDGLAGVTVTFTSGTAGEQNAAKVKICIIDQTEPEAWVDNCKVISTGGAQGSMFAGATAPNCP